MVVVRPLLGLAPLLLAIPSGAAAAAGQASAGPTGAILAPASGLLPQSVRNVVVDPHAADTIRSRAARALPLPAAALLTAPEAAELCAEGLLASLDSTGGGCAVPSVEDPLLLLGHGIAAQHWRDLWDIARLPGRRGLPREAIGVLEIALLADGVAPDRVYATLDTEDGARRAFRKLDQLRPYIAWWSDGGEARQALLSGAVLMTVLPAGQLDDDRALAGGASAWLAVPLVWTAPLVADANGGSDEDAPGIRERLDALAAETRPVAAPDRPSTLAVSAAFWRTHAELRGRFRAWLGA